MNNQTFYRFFTLLAFMLLTVTTTPVANAQSDQHTVAEPVQLSAAGDSMRRALNHWTPEEIATAPAFGLLVDYSGAQSAEDSDNSASTRNRVDDKDNLRAGSVRGRGALRGSKVFHRQQYPSDWIINDDVDFGKYYQQDTSLDHSATDSMKPRSRGLSVDYPVNEKTALWKLYPHVLMGKLNFTTAAGNSSCSATAIRNNHIVTAAHCVFGTSGENVWYSNKVFTPAYRNGNAPFGTFPTTQCRVLRGWINLSGSYRIKTWARHDVAVCRTGKNSAGWTLNEAVGYAGYSYNYNYKQLHFVSGYPARDINDKLLSGPAQYLRSCTGESFQHASQVLGSGCSYGRGISGGSWLKNYNANYVTGQVNSVNSGVYVGEKNIYGARFTSSNIKRLCNASGC